MTEGLRTACVGIAGWLAAVSMLFAADRLETLRSPQRKPYRVEAAGFVTDAGHPKHPGGFQRYDETLRVSVDPRIGEATLEFEDEEDGQKSTTRYFVRAGRIFQLDDKNAEVAPKPYGDLAPATIAALHPALVAQALAGDRANAAVDSGAIRFAWNDALWNVVVDRKQPRITRVERKRFHEVHGDRTETVRFEAFDGAGGSGRAVAALAGREIASFTFGAPVEVESIERAPLAGESSREHVLTPEDIRFEEIAPAIFRADLVALNTRVFVAELADSLLVFEGAYASRACDVIVERIRERFGKPIRYFAFSHLHGQYVGGTRSYVHAGATILVPPSTEPLIREIAQAPNELRPDALSREPKPLTLETVAKHKHIEDATTPVDLYNVESGHTDEYFLVHFPKAKVLLTGDLLFYRPGQPLAGRSKQLCATLAKLGIEVEQLYPTWPLDGYGTKNVVNGEEMRAACSP